MKKVQEEKPVELSEIKSLDSSISLKLSEMMPDIVSKIKEEVIRESHIREPKKE